ncbi:MAG: hypothetical protein LBT88_06575 [Oscillospiraceae bacterium]|jgi:hypothetical protein|nr:hypothetical protein [Oscillospiraceae bacterium]
MLNFLSTNWKIIIIVIFALIGVVTAIVRKEWKRLDEILFYLVTEAERSYGDATGAFKFAQVFTYLISNVSLLFKIFVPTGAIENKVEIIVNAAKEIWTKNPKLIGKE